MSPPFHLTCAFRRRTLAPMFGKLTDALYRLAHEIRDNTRALKTLNRTLRAANDPTASFVVFGPMRLVDKP